jgi:hypothetical protein
MKSTPGEARRQGTNKLLMMLLLLLFFLVSAGGTVRTYWYAWRGVPNRALPCAARGALNEYRQDRRLLDC